MGIRSSGFPVKRSSSFDFRNGGDRTFVLTRDKGRRRAAFNQTPLLSTEAMQPDLRYELLFFYTRNELEHLQPVSQSLHDMIVVGSNVLPLRPIYRVDLDSPDTYVYSKDKILIDVEEPTDDSEPIPDYVASVHDGDFAETFRRLQNTCIEEFNVGLRNNHFLRYWKAQEAAVFTVVRICFEPPDAKDYDVLDAIVNHLRPRTTNLDYHYIYIPNESSWHQDHYNNMLEVMARASFLNNLQTCCLSVLHNALPPSSFFLNNPGYANYELVSVHSNVADGIDRLIESFVRHGCANEKLESVCVMWKDSENQQPCAPRQLRKPTKVDVPLNTNYLTSWISPDVKIRRVSKCEMHSFVNTKQWMRMDVFKWTAKYYYYGRGTAHIVRCRVRDL